MKGTKKYWRLKVHLKCLLVPRWNREGGQWGQKKKKTNKENRVRIRLHFDKIQQKRNIKTRKLLKEWKKAWKGRKGSTRLWLCWGRKATQGQQKDSLPTVRYIAFLIRLPNPCLIKHHSAVINTHLHTKTQWVLENTEQDTLHILHHSWGESVRQSIFHFLSHPLLSSFPVLCSLVVWNWSLKLGLHALEMYNVSLANLQALAGVCLEEHVLTPILLRTQS